VAGVGRAYTERKAFDGGEKGISEIDGRLSTEEKKEEIVVYYVAAKRRMY